LYGFDVAHYKTYGGLIAEGGYAAWADAFLGDSEADYQSKVGGLDAIHQLALPAY
jgi:glutaconate CoA-transferase subunit A